MLRRLRTPVAAVLLLLLVVPAAHARKADPLPDYEFAGPVFGLTLAPDGSLLVADSGAGIVELRKGQGSVVAALPGVADVDAIGRGSMFAITGGGEGDTAARLYRISRGNVREIANLGAFEAAVNPDGGVIESNPFDVAALNGGQALIADAAGNSLLIADQQGNVDWVATLPLELVPTANAKQIVGCPTPPPGLEFVCEFPELLPAEPVATSVAIGPDGAYYVGELKGFPAPTGESRVWRIEPGTRHAQCGTSPACTVVADGFTSIVDLAFGPDGTLYVVELDEASWLAAEFGQGAGGTVNACTAGGGSWNCAVVASGLIPNPTAVAISRDGTIYASLIDFGTFQSQVTMLP
jgi:hypothetical protein